MDRRQKKLHRDMRPRDVLDCFSSASGKRVWNDLMRFYNARFTSEMSSYGIAFKAGQRDVVQYLFDLMTMAKKYGATEKKIEIGDEE